MAWEKRINSQEYEWESPFETSCELGVDVVHAYVTQPNVVDESCIESNELDSKISLVDYANPSMNYLDLDSFRDFPIGSTSLITKDNSSHINNLKASTFLSPMHCDLIDQSIKNQRPNLPSFQNDYEITCYMNSIKPWYLPLVNQQFNMDKKYIK